MRKRCKTGIPGSDVNAAARLQAAQSCARRRLEGESSQIYIRGGFSFLCVSNPHQQKLSALILDSGHRAARGDVTLRSSGG